MLEYITFSQGKSKTRTSADIYSPLVANCKGPGRSAREGTEWFMQNFPKTICGGWTQTRSKTRVNALFWPESPHSCNRPKKKHYLMPNKRSHEWIQKTTAEEQSEWIEVIESHHQREREKILSFEYCTHYNGPEELCAVKSYALVKLNKGKVFPHEGQMRISKWKCRQMSKSWGRLSAVWPRHLTHILRLQIYSPSLSLSLSLPLYLYLARSSCACVRQTSRARRSELIKGFIPLPGSSRIAIWTLFIHKCCPGNNVYFYYRLGGRKKEEEKKDK